MREETEKAAKEGYESGSKAVKNVKPSDGPDAILAAYGYTRCTVCKGSGERTNTTFDGMHHIPQEGSCKPCNGTGFTRG